MHATVYGRGQMVIPARARKEARIETGDVVNVLPEGDGRLVLVRMERAEAKTTEQGSNHSPERKTLIAFHSPDDFARGSLQSVGTISTVTYLLDVNMLIAAIWQDHEDQSRSKPGWAANKLQLARLANSAFCESAAATHFHFEPKRRLAETLFRNLFGNTAAGLLQTIFHPKESPRSRVDNLPICILPNWLKNIE